MRDSEKGQACLGLLIGIFLVFGWLALLIGSIWLLVEGIQLQTSLDQPQLYYLHREVLDPPALTLNVAYPTKVPLPSETYVLVWVSPSDSTGIVIPLTATAVITVAASAQPPLFVKQEVITLTVNTATLRSGNPVQIDYTGYNIETDNRSVQMDFIVTSSISTVPQPMSVDTLLDTGYTRRRIVIMRIWEILGIILGALIPIVVGVLAGN